MVLGFKYRCQFTL